MLRSGNAEFPNLVVVGSKQHIDVSKVNHFSQETVSIIAIVACDTLGNVILRFWFENNIVLQNYDSSQKS